MVGNRRLSNFFESVILQSTCFFHYCAFHYSTFKGVLDSRLETTPSNHRQIFEAIKSGDKEVAEKLILKHIKIAYELNKIAMIINDINGS